MNLPEFREIKDAHKVLKDLDYQITYLEEQNAYLRKENERTKKETYAAEELQKMTAERDAWRKRALRGFDITEQDEAAIEAWKEKHDREKHGLDTLEKRMRAGGVSGGRYSYHFVPTAIGTFATCRCDICGEEFEFNDV